MPGIAKGDIESLAAGFQRIDVSTSARLEG